MSSIRCRIEPVLVFIILVAAAVSSGAAGEFRFGGPFGVAVNSRDVVYVAEIDNRRISMFTPEGKWLGAIEQIEGYGQLAGPFDVCVGPQDRLYITDTRAHRVLVLDAEHRLQSVLGKEKSAAAGDFIEPHFVAVNDRGEIFVSDTFNARVQKFAADGTYLMHWGRTGQDPGEFLHNGYLGGISCDNRGHVYVREVDGGRVQKFTENGKHVATFGRRGSAPGELDEGYGCVVRDDTLWLIDTFASRVQQWSLEGEVLAVWAPGEGNGGSHFNHPVDAAFTRSGHIIITDWKNNRVVKLNDRGEFLESFGQSMDDLLAYEPPQRVERPPGHRVMFSAYIGFGDRDLEACRNAGIEMIYPSFSNQEGPWNISQHVARARELGIEVSPSIAMYPLGSKSELGRNPELFIWKKGADQPMSGILSWAQPIVRSFRAQVLKEQTELSGNSGIMLDYIRYLGNDLCYDPIALQAYQAKYGVDPRTLQSDHTQWMQFRADYITQFIVELRRELARLDRPIEVSAFAGSEPKLAMLNTMQDWPTWVKMGIIDKLSHGIYTRDFEHIYNEVRRLRETVPARTRINILLACYGGNLNTPELLRKGIDVAVAAGADEITIYRGDVIWELNLWDAIGQANLDVNGPRK